MQETQETTLDICMGGQQGSETGKCALNSHPQLLHSRVHTDIKRPVTCCFTPHILLTLSFSPALLTLLQSRELQCTRGSRPQHQPCPTVPCRTHLWVGRDRNNRCSRRRSNTSRRCEGKAVCGVLSCGSSAASGAGLCCVQHAAVQLLSVAL